MLCCYYRYKSSSESSISARLYKTLSRSTAFEVKQTEQSHIIPQFSLLNAAVCVWWLVSGCQLVLFVVADCCSAM